MNCIAYLHSVRTESPTFSLLSDHIWLSSMQLMVSRPCIFNAGSPLEIYFSADQEMNENMLLFTSRVTFPEGRPPYFPDLIELSQFWPRIFPDAAFIAGSVHCMPHQLHTQSLA